MKGSFWVLVAVVALNGCSSSDDKSGAGGASSGDECKPACDKIVQCNPGTVCSITCDSDKGRAVANCIVKAECSGINQCMMSGGGGSGGGGGGGLGGGGGSVGGAGGGSGAACSTLLAKCSSCSAAYQSQCQSVVQLGQEAMCQTVLDSAEFKSACP